jgi:hypothetical protein
MDVRFRGKNGHAADITGMTSLTDGVEKGLVIIDEP